MVDGQSTSHVSVQTFTALSSQYASMYTPGRSVDSGYGTRRGGRGGGRRGSLDGSTSREKRDGGAREDESSYNTSRTEPSSGDSRPLRSRFASDGGPSLSRGASSYDRELESPRDGRGWRSERDLVDTYRDARSLSHRERARESTREWDRNREGDRPSAWATKRGFVQHPSTQSAHHRDGITRRRSRSPSSTLRDRVWGSRGTQDSPQQRSSSPSAESAERPSTSAAPKPASTDLKDETPAVTPRRAWGPGTANSTLPPTMSPSTHSPPRRNPLDSPSRSVDQDAAPDTPKYPQSMTSRQMGPGTSDSPAGTGFGLSRGGMVAPRGRGRGGRGSFRGRGTHFPQTAAAPPRTLARKRDMDGAPLAPDILPALAPPPSIDAPFDPVAMDLAYAQEHGTMETHSGQLEARDSAEPGEVTDTTANATLSRGTGPMHLDLSDMDGNTSGPPTALPTPMTPFAPVARRQIKVAYTSSSFPHSVNAEVEAELANISAVRLSATAAYFSITATSSSGMAHAPSVRPSLRAALLGLRDAESELGAAHSRVEATESALARAREGAEAYYAQEEGRKAQLMAAIEAGQIV